MEIFFSIAVLVVPTVLFLAMGFVVGNGYWVWEPGFPTEGDWTMEQQTISQHAVNLANNALIMEEILQPKINRIMDEAHELGNNHMTAGNAIIHALRHGIINLDEAQALMLNNHVIWLA